MRRLANHRFRDKEKKFLVEGVRFVEEALNSTWPVEMLVYSKKSMGNQRLESLFKTAADRKITLLWTANVMHRLPSCKKVDGAVRRFDRRLSFSGSLAPSLLEMTGQNVVGLVWYRRWKPAAPSTSTPTCCRRRRSGGSAGIAAGGAEVDCAGRRLDHHGDRRQSSAAADAAGMLGPRSAACRHGQIRHRDAGGLRHRAHLLL